MSQKTKCVFVKHTGLYGETKSRLIKNLVKKKTQLKNLIRLS